MTPPVDPGRLAHSEGVAQVSARGEHGHLGQYDRRVQFASVNRADGVPPADCALPAALF